MKLVPLFGMLILGGLLFLNAQNQELTAEEWRRPLHTKPLKDMTKEELRAYKATVEARARELGILQQSKGFQPLPEDKKAKQKPMPKRIPGTSIQYDSGNVIGTAGVASQMLGNRFDTALNPPGTNCCFPVETAGTITMVTFNMVNTFFSSAVVSIYSNIMGATAMQVTSMGIPVVTGLNTVTLGGGGTMNMYANGPFLAGIWQFDLMSTAVAVDTGSTGGQGFHAVSLNDGTTGTMLVNVPSQNVVFRVQGNVATPVELMNFKVE